jgi:hypothetical protein
VLLKRVFDLPLGVHELVVDFLPAPRIWKTCIHRLKRRVTLAPQAATLDISIMLDEMITDMCLFRPPHQRGHLVTLSRSEAVRQYLREQWHMPVGLMEELVSWSDVQSLIARSADCDVTFKANLARKFLLLAASLHRFISSVSNPRVLFSFSTLRSARCSHRGGGLGDLVKKSSSATSAGQANVWSDDSSGSGSSGEGRRKEEGEEKESFQLRGTGEQGGAGSCHDMMDIDFLVNTEDDEQQQQQQEEGGGGRYSGPGVKMGASPSLIPLHMQQPQHPSQSHSQRSTIEPAGQLKLTNQHQHHQHQHQHQHHQHHHQHHHQQQHHQQQHHPQQHHHYEEEGEGKIMEELMTETTLSARNPPHAAMHQYQDDEFELPSDDDDI